EDRRLRLPDIAAEGLLIDTDRDRRSRLEAHVAGARDRRTVRNADRRGRAWDQTMIVVGRRARRRRYVDGPTADRPGVDRNRRLTTVRAHIVDEITDLVDVPGHEVEGGIDRARERATSDPSGYRIGSGQRDVARRRDAPRHLDLLGVDRQRGRP